MGKVTRKRRAGKEIRLLDGEQVDVGVDSHKRSYKVALWSFERGVVATWTQGADPQALARKLEPHRERIRRVVYEAGPTGYGLVRELRNRGSPLWRPAPRFKIAAPRAARIP